MAEVKADIDVEPPEASGSLKAKGKGGFKFPSFNRRDKKPKMDKPGIFVSQLIRPEISSALSDVQDTCTCISIFCMCF